jgi:D-alanine-D-alanine ligase
MRIVLLTGGTSSEREVSFMSASEVKRALMAHETTVIEIPEDGGTDWITQMLETKPQLAVLAALHGGTGENGAVQGLLTCLGIPYTGSKVLGSAICMDKAVSKSIMRTNNLTVPDDILVPACQPLALYRDAAMRLGFPLVVKPNQGGSSVGVSIADDADALEAAFKTAAASGDDILIEQFIPGREITCALIETADELITLPLLDIAAADGFYDYNAKYFDDGTQISASILPAFIKDSAGLMARRAFEKLGCRGYARVDMIVRDEQVYVLEVNTLPGMTPHSLMPKAAALYGWDYTRLVEEIIAYEAHNIRGVDGGPLG